MPPSASLPPSLAPLSLPPMPLQLRRRADGQAEIFDALRQRYVRLTPEEWVRQHFCHWLVSEMGYPAALTANEVSLRTGGAVRRADTVVFRREGGMPHVVVEYKAPSITLTQRVLDQIVSYNRTLCADYLFISNGLAHYAFRIDSATGLPSLLPCVPRYESL